MSTPRARSGSTCSAPHSWPGGPTAPPDDSYSHIAFGIRDRDLPEVEARIRASGVEIWQGNRSEGASLYFRDPAGHRLELHATDLEERLDSARASPWEGLVLEAPF